MRVDLNKVLCERERHRSHMSYREVRNLDPGKPARRIEEEDDEPFTGQQHSRKCGIAAPHRNHNKDFNEHLNPLWGIVRKNVGRPWDKIYSEICEVFDKRSVINQHILDHLDGFVERRFLIKNDELFLTRHYYRKMVPLKGSSVEYYVDPRDGILKRNKSYKSYSQAARDFQNSRAKKLLEIQKVVDKDTILRKKDGTWFEVKLKPKQWTLPQYGAWESQGDIWNPTEGYDEYNFVFRNKTVVSVRTLSKKELKLHGLK